MGRKESSFYDEIRMNWNNNLIEFTEFYVQSDSKNIQPKNFNKISRLRCCSNLAEMDLEIDINTDLCCLNVGDSFKLVLASMLGPTKKKSTLLLKIIYQNSIMSR